MPARNISWREELKLETAKQFLATMWVPSRYTKRRAVFICNRVPLTQQCRPLCFSPSLVNVYYSKVWGSGDVVKDTFRVARLVIDFDFLPGVWTLATHQINLQLRVLSVTWEECMLCRVRIKANTQLKYLTEPVTQNQCHWKWVS